MGWPGGEGPRDGPHWAQLGLRGPPHPHSPVARGGEVMEVQGIFLLSCLRKEKRRDSSVGSQQLQSEFLHGNHIIRDALSMGTEQCPLVAGPCKVR